MNEQKNINTCNECGCECGNLIEITVGGESMMVCPDCINAKFVRCWECDEWIPTDEAITTVSGHLICESCRQDFYYTCEDCGEVIHEDDIRETGDGSYVCVNCLYDNYFLCNRCGEWHRDDEGQADEYGNTICNGCADEYYAECGECGRLVDRDEAYWDDDAEEYYCNRCVGNCEALHNYSYKPAPKFHFRKSELTTCEKAGLKPEDSIFQFGLEVEVDGGSRTDRKSLVPALAKLEAPIYMKRDGSLGNYGVEIVTHPCSLAYHTYEFGWASIARTCVSHNYRSHDTSTCGLHIHVGNRALGESWEARQPVLASLSILFYQLWEELVKFSRRREYQLDDWANRPHFSCWDEPLFPEDDTELMEKAIRAINDSRYMSVNIQNHNTVEFRIFRGTLKRTTLLASIQLVNNLTKYAMTHSPRECISAKWADVIGIEQFKELNAYCVERGLA